MRRFIALASLLLFSIPFGVSISGCHKATAVTYCNGSAGTIVGQVTTLTLSPRLTGISLNQGQISQINAPTATDCKGTAASAGAYSYGAADLNGKPTDLVDVATASGRICAGIWNRNTGGGIPDFTTCTANGKIGTAYVTATGAGISSNPLAVYVHPIVTSVLLGPPSANCTTDPASNCAFDATKPNGCASGAPAVGTIKNYDGSSCVSQGTVTQLAARAFAGTDITLPANNISCLVGPLTFTAQNAGIVGINQAGQATAVQPGSSVINASITQSSSSAGFFSTCPPASIVLSLPKGQTGTSVSVNQNNPQQILAAVTDTNGVPLNNITLEYVSTTPTTIPVAAGVTTPTFPGGAAITAICQPPSCNPSPYNQIGLFGNGLTVTSNPITVTTPGTNSTVLYIASTDSQYIVPVDFTNNNQGSPVRLPYVPNSMVISQDLNTIYMGSTTELMTFSATTNALINENPSVAGTVLAVSPDNTTVVITDPVRKLVYLLSTTATTPGTTNTSSTEYGGVGTRAVWAPDSSAVYITTTDNRLLVHSTFTGWNAVDLSASGSTLPFDEAVTIPSVGVFLSGSPETARTICPTSSVTGPNGLQTVANTFYPKSDTAAASADRIAATNDGLHIFGANTSTFSDLKVSVPRGACPSVPASGPSPTPTFSPVLATNPAFTGITPTAITAVVPTSDSAFGFVAYTGTGGLVPQYNPATLALSYIKLNGTAVAPVAEIISTDNQTLFAGTTGDNLVHLLKRGSSGFADSVSTTGVPIPLVPNLPSISGTGTAVPNLLVQRPRKSNS